MCFCRLKGSSVLKSYYLGSCMLLVHLKAMRKKEMHIISMHMILGHLAKYSWCFDCIYNSSASLFWRFCFPGKLAHRQGQIKIFVGPWATGTLRPLVIFSKEKSYRKLKFRHFNGVTVTFFAHHFAVRKTRIL